MNLWALPHHAVGPYWHCEQSCSLSKVHVVFSFLWSMFLLGAMIVLAIMIFQFGIALFFGSIGAVMSLFEKK